MRMFFVGSKTIAAFSVLSAVVLLTGCSSGKNQDFEAVASRLDNHGCYYRVSDNSELYSTAGKIFKDFEQAVASGYGSGNSGNEKLMALLSATELAVRFAGVAECRWSGASSVRLPDTIEKTFRNKSFYLLPEKPRGIAWRIPGAVNRPVIREVAGLPADTLFAGDFILDLRGGEKVFTVKGSGKHQLTHFCEKFFKTTPDLLFRNISGEWGVAIFPSRKMPDNFEFVLTLPDREALVFKSLAGFFRMIPGAKVGKDTVIVPDLGKGLAPVCVYVKGRLTIFSNAGTQRHFLASGTELASQPDFKRLSSGLPEDGLAVFYSAGVRPETRGMLLPEIFGGSPFDPSGIDRPQLTVLRREDNGLSLISNSGFDIPSSDFVNLVVVPLLAGASYWKEIEALLPGKPAAVRTVNKPVVMSKTDKENIEKCLTNVKKIASSLKAYFSAHGNYPLSAEFTGLNQLQAFRKTGAEDFICPASKKNPAKKDQKLENSNCSYVYFGAWKKQQHPKLPLLVDRPENHSGYCHVVFNDGSVAGFKIENTHNLKRIASFLHTKFSYGEDDFLELIRRADMLDALFEQF